MDWCINFINELARKFMYCKGMWKIDEWFFFLHPSPEEKKKSYFSYYQKSCGKNGREEKEINVYFFFLLIKENFSWNEMVCIFLKNVIAWTFNMPNHNSV